MQRPPITLIAILILLLSVGCQSALERGLDAALADPDQTGISWGLVVADMSGEELLVRRPDERFLPASNTKIISTMAAYHHLDALSTEAASPGTRLYVEIPEDETPPRLVLTGGGDAMLSDDPACESTCLASLADVVAGWGLTEVSAVIGDDSLYPFERWGPGWSQEDLTFYFGTAISALSVNDNLVWVEVSPGTAADAPAEISWLPGDDYYALQNDALTAEPGATSAVRFERLPGAQTIRIYGEVPVDASPRRYRLAIDDPARYTAWRFSNLLEERGITVGEIGTRHRPLSLSDEAPDPEEATMSATQVGQTTLPDYAAKLPPSRLTDSLRRISKDSENLHADLLVRRLGLLTGTGSRDYGVAEIEAFLHGAGLPEHGYNIHDGSGMSVYNRISPRSMVQLLGFAAEQPWFEAWLADQPVGGVDGSLRRRFVGTPLEGRIFAKTGTLSGTNALSGVLIAKSGRRLLFSIIANDRPQGAGSATPQMDAALVAIAARF